MTGPSNTSYPVNAPFSLGRVGGLDFINDPQKLFHAPGPPAPVLFVRPSPRTPKEYRASTSEEDCSYLAILIDKALGGAFESGILHHTFLCCFNYWDALLYEQ